MSYKVFGAERDKDRERKRGRERCSRFIRDDVLGPFQRLNSGFRLLYCMVPLTVLYVLYVPVDATYILRCGRDGYRTCRRPTQIMSPLVTVVATPRARESSIMSDPLFYLPSLSRPRPVGGSLPA